MSLIRTYGVVLFLAMYAESILALESDIEIPENAKTAWISNNINQSGMLLSIRTFDSKNPVEAVLDFYRVSWFKEGRIPGFIEQEMMEWKIISQLRDNDNVVLQIKPNGQGGSTGFLSIAKTDGRSQSIELDFPLPDATEEFSTTYLQEDGSDVHTMTFITKQSVGTTSAFYRDRLKRQGWTVAEDTNVQGSQILLFNRRDDRCEMVIQKLNSEDTVIFVNRVQRDA